MKRWNIKNTDASKSLIERVLINRGLTSSSLISEFLNQGKKDYLDPFLMKDMQRAVERIRQAVQKGERIIVYGDYDVDGISGTAVLMHTLKKLQAKASYRIPHRLDDGYGLHIKYINEFAELGIGLVITVDCGISCSKEISHAKEKNIDVIISDHHTIPENFPHDAYAVLHPLQTDCPYPFKGLTGSGVAFKLAHALLAETPHAEFIHSLSDLASFGTVADLGPLLDENRTIVTRGLEAFQNTRWIGLKYLKKISGIKEDRHPHDASIIGFQIAPRINAAGRMDSPYYALQLLLHDDEQKAEALAKKLEDLNNKRRELTFRCCEEAVERISDTEIPPAIVASSPGWHTGILGLVAAKVAEKFNRPAFMFHDRGDFLVASVRSPAQYNVMNMLNEAKDLMKTFGGHAQAAGLTVSKENFQKFHEKMIEVATKYSAEEGAAPLNIDCELLAEDISLENINLLERLQPFGIGNEQPTFAIKNARITDLRTVGKNQEHLKIKCESEGKEIDGIAFRAGHQEKDLKSRQHISIAGHLEKNTFNGRTKIQMNIVDLQ